MRALLFLLLVLALWASPASAHRLDEYLEATTIDAGTQRVALEVRLTPGVDVAPGILKAMDTNRDRHVSDAERHAYAEQVRLNLSLSIDQAPRPLWLVAIAFSTDQQMRRGAGGIVLRFEAAGAGAGGAHRLTFENRHRRDIGIYLVNTLIPHEPGLSIRSQDRSFDQSRYSLDFVTGSMAHARQNEAIDVANRSVFGPFFRHGIRHILTGYDHLLFGAALVLGAATLWELIKVVTAFTVAHSLTLTVAALGLVRVPEALVEPVIAGSIVFVALQNALRPSASQGRARLFVAFLFGLFHGLGFAGGLLDLLHDMPAPTFLLALLAFSLGIEAGNQLVLLPLLGALKAIGIAGGEPIQARPFTTTFRRIASLAIAFGGTAYLALALGSAAAS
ncbi:MAG: HupE/UreJ family protein [Alphaproteobacteria bacterium]|nr:MAG: HupE/UreJ family protein [Alphaproteobacteria bacterium]